MKQYQQLNILCVGEIAAGKTSFLQQYTHDSADTSTYKIFIKQVENIIVYFHELSEEEELYLACDYDGLLFFVDFLSFWNVQCSVLKWIENYSRMTGINLFKIPIRIIVMKEEKDQYQAEKLKKKLEKQLGSILQNNQIMYFCPQVLNKINDYFYSLAEGKAEGIKCSYYTLWKLEGTSEMFKTMFTNVKLTFLRLIEIYKHFRYQKTEKRY